MADEDFLAEKLAARERDLALRTLKEGHQSIDFCSNDYLGLARNEDFKREIADEIYRDQLSHGSTGSRLLSGNHALFRDTERLIAETHHTEAALIFNSGYDANVGLMSSVAGRGDVILYDSLVHASIRDGVRLSPASAHSFMHNDPDNLERKLKRSVRRSFVVVESIYSMDGDEAPLREIAALCERYAARLIVDEAHATGIAGVRGSGEVQRWGLEEACFARVHTFGKALGVHGAAVVGSATLKRYLVNYARPFIYTTALPPASVAAIAAAYRYFPRMDAERGHLRQLISLFRQAAVHFRKLPSETPVQVILTPGNAAAKTLAAGLQRKGFDIRPILHPTVPEGKERLRIVMHSFNTTNELQKLIAGLREAAQHIP